jgi:hypothetical protein
MKLEMRKVQLQKLLHKVENEINLIIKGDNNNVNECKITRVS